MYYDTEKPIPLDTQVVSRRLRVGTQALATVLEDFFVRTETGYKHARCDAEIAEYNRKAKAARANGKKGGRRKAAPALDENPVGTDPVSKPNPGKTQTLANQEPLTNINTTSSLRSEVTREEISKPAKRVPAVAKPDDVAERTWQDWQQLRKAKRAPVTETVLQKARQEAGKAGIALDDFLQVWCARGSQGLEAAWLTPAERRRGPPQENFSAVDYGSGIHDL